MISVRPKVKNLNFHLFGRPVHPELFNRCALREFVRDNYRLLVTITTTGHLISFQHDNHVLTEFSASDHQPVPLSPVLSYALDATSNNKLVHNQSIDYESHTQLEGVNPKTFVTIQQQLDEQATCEGLVHRFQPSGRNGFGAISYINVQSFHAHVRIRSFHTFPDTYAVLKSESKFTVVNPRDMDNPAT